MGSLFNKSIGRAVRSLWRKKWYVAGLLVFEVARDRAAGWANNKIDEDAEGVVKTLAEFVQSNLTFPVGWTIAVAIVVLLFLFIHSYPRENRECS